MRNPRSNSRRILSAIVAGCCALGALLTVGAPTTHAAQLAYPVPMLELDLATRDIVWDPVHRLIYASVPADASTDRNTIAVIDPDTWEVVRTVPAGNNPGKLAIAADASMLYVGLDADGAVGQFSLPDLTPVRQFSLGNPFGTPNTASDMVVLLDNPNAVVVSSSQGRSTAVFVHGAQLPDVVHGDYDLEPSPDPGQIYGVEQTSSFPVAKMVVTSTGISIASSVAGLIPSMIGMTVAGGKLYVSGVGSTQVIDAQTLTIVSTLIGAAGDFAVDEEAGLVYPARAISASGQRVLRPYRSDTLEAGPDLGLTIDDDAFSFLGLDGGALALETSDFAGLERVGKLYLLLPGLLRGAAGEFTSLDPSRILDTRDGTGAPAAPIPADSSIDVQITGAHGVPPTGVDAVVLNATVTQPTAPGFLTIWPTGLTRPTISNLNFQPNQTVANLVTVSVGAGGKVSVYNSHGTSHVVFDVAGYYSTSGGTPGARYHPVAPTRLFDTRTQLGGVRPRLGPNDSIRFDVTGVAGVPADGATAVVMNVTAAAPSAAGYITVSPDGARPVVSNVNFPPGRPTSNLVIVRVPDTGVIEFFSEFGSVDILADVVGYYDLDRSTEHGRLVTYQPYRAFDSRDESPFGGDGRLEPDSVLILGTDATARSAFVLNITVTQPTSFGFLTAFPYPSDVPDSSSVNFQPGETVPNMAIVPTGPQMGFYNVFGFTHVIVDVFGDFT